ncbi:MAG: EF-hand domain-containing protein [Gammaproteobacteria bacterium]|nr:EF-hand domain-containing protein [Gammaproteobacteria bacterium]MBU1489756.1 EF-hand domain-containing protein [Gammaproteobacteria bacterium]MBU2067675.1 EF-hand domain-containing protein [Gammaproteobacteria bacterium]MBU2138324.1 EF-hand domain-containing protein [Gammaproteobacteria bacterium]MBU2218470.1 EF-hand domain-containing protein [Gammaproteobacteria bacterium]
MISGVSGYSSYSSTLASTQRSSNGSCGAGDSTKMQEKLFSLLDSNSDGSVAKDELDSALSAAKEVDSSLSIDIDALLSQLDANGDGSLDQEETAALMPPPPPSGGPAPEDLLTQLDANGDGSIDQDELNAITGSDDSGELLGELDTDGDGNLNLDELSALAPPPPTQPMANLDSLFGQITTDGGNAIDQSALGSVFDSLSQNASSDKAASTELGLVAKLLEQYQSSANYSSRIGSQLNLSA